MYKKPICEPRCPERKAGCHAECEKFKKWRAGVDEDKKQRFAAKKLEKVIEDIRSANKERRE